MLAGIDDNYDDRSGETGSVLTSDRVRFRSVDASVHDPVTAWPYEAIVTVIDRGLVEAEERDHSSDGFVPRSSVRR